MQSSRFSQEQVIGILKQGEAGALMAGDVGPYLSRRPAKIGTQRFDLPAHNFQINHRGWGIRVHHRVPLAGNQAVPY